MKPALFIDDKSIEFIKERTKKENVQAVRIFIAGGGCCKRPEIITIRKALAGDTTYERDGVKIYLEKGLAESSSAIDIKFDEQKGLIIEFQK